MTEINAEKTEPLPVAEKTPRTSWAVWLLAIVLIFLIGSATALYFLPVVKDRLPILARWLGAEASLKPDFSPLESRLDQQDVALQTLRDANIELTRRLDSLSDNIPAEADANLLKRLEKLEQHRPEKPTGDMSRSARIDMLLGRMSQLEASFVPLSKGLADAQTARLERSQLIESSAALSGRLDQLESRLVAVESYAARDNSGALIAFRISDLRRKVTSGKAFGPEITALDTMTSHGSLAANDALQESISWLKQHKDGVIPPDRLRQQFDALIPALIRARSRHEDDPWWKRLYNNGRNLIMIRKTLSPDKGSSDGIIAHVQQELARLDLKEALSYLGRLSENMRDSVNIWMMQAEIYLQAENQLDRIESLTASAYLDSSDKMPQKTPPDGGTSS